MKKHEVYVYDYLNPNHLWYRPISYSSSNELGNEGVFHDT